MKFIVTVFACLSITCLSKAIDYMPSDRVNYDLTSTETITGKVSGLSIHGTSATFWIGKSNFVIGNNTIVLFNAAPIKVDELSDIIDNKFPTANVFTEKNNVLRVEFFTESVKTKSAWKSCSICPEVKNVKKFLSYTEGVKEMEIHGQPMITFVGLNPTWDDEYFVISTTPTLTGYTAPSIVVSEIKNGQHVRVAILEANATSANVRQVFLKGNQDCSNGRCGPIRSLFNGSNCSNGSCQPQPVSETCPIGGCSSGNCPPSGTIIRRR